MIPIYCQATARSWPHSRGATESLGVHLHQVSASTLQQLCDDASDTVLIENNGVTPD